MATFSRTLLARFAAQGDQDLDTGTGSGFGKAVLITTGVSALMACLLTLVYVPSIHSKVLAKLY